MSFQTASAFGAMYEYSCDCAGSLVNVSSVVSTTGMAVALEPDVVLVVQPAHPVDRAVLVGADVVRDDDAGLLGARSRGPGKTRAVDEVGRLLAGQHELAVEALLRPDEEVRAEALVVRAVRDHVLAAEHRRVPPVERELAQQRVREVADAGRERHERRLVVDPRTNVRALPLHRDPVRDRLEHVAARKRLPDRDDRLDRRAGRDGRQERALRRQEAFVLRVRLPCGRSRDGERRQRDDDRQKSFHSHRSPPLSPLVKISDSADF